MCSILRKIIKHKDEDDDKTTLMMKNGAIVLKELIASSHGKYNPYRIFSAQELKQATSNYDPQGVVVQGLRHTWTTDLGKIAKHDHSFNLYRGFWQERPISVMKFNGNLPDAYERCINNIVYTSQMNHKHITKLIGCCLEVKIPILVFEYVERGSLYDRIFGASRCLLEPLLLTQRLKIAMDIAHAVAYLHAGFSRPIIFRNIKTPSILFNEQNDAKLFDFSPSISIPEGETHAKVDESGKWDVWAPEYVSKSDYNEKLDVHSFGVFLIELLTGKKCQDLLGSLGDGDVDFPSLEKLKKFFEKGRLKEIIGHLIVEDSSCPGKGKQLQPLLQLIIECVDLSPVVRPTMVDVAKRLRPIYRCCCV